jgi:penicillin-binding protein 1B
MSKSPKRRSHRASSPHKTRRFLIAFLLAMLLPGLVALTIYVFYLDHLVQQKFEGKRWSIPSRVYARALEVYPQAPLTAEALQTELQLVGYQPSSDGLAPGSYHREGNAFVISSRAFTHWDGEEPARSLRLMLSDNQVVSLTDARSGKPLKLVRLQPMQIGSIYPAQKEDRILVKLSELPPLLTTALQAVEDRNFQEHHGIDLSGIARAAWSNLRAGHVVQGGSTLTQQLVKNFYLGSERTFIRKINEAIMSLSLEYHYNKDEILEAYANEIYLGQEGARAIHGFGLAAQFYFNKPVQELTLPESTMLVAILRGPTYYDPRRSPKRVLERRNQIIDTLLNDGVIDQAKALRAKQAPLGIMRSSYRGTGLHPAFLDLVKRQLQKDYQEEDLRSEGLRIFTTLDPIAQQTAEQSLIRWTQQLEQQRKLKSDSLQGGVVITHVGSGEVSAIVGGRDVRFAGFNRALDIRRPIGSLVKPALYLTALSQPQRYTLTTMINDEPLQLKQQGSKVWSPENYDHTAHGAVPLIDALAHSYNLAAVNLGMALGVNQVVNTLHQLGIEEQMPNYPSVLLGSVELAPIEIAQMYQTLADQGFYTPLRAVREVLTQDGKPLQHYAMETEQRFSDAHVYLLNYALREALRHGTGANVAQQIPAEIELAGKTGTTDDLRDSWFAGFGNDYVGVVWMGSDDNRVTGLTGASGALQVWGDVMSKITLTRGESPPPAEVEMVRIDRLTGLLAESGCEETGRPLPFISGTAPEGEAPCASSGVEEAVKGVIDTVKGWFE